MIHGLCIPTWGLVLVLTVNGCLADDNDGDVTMGGGGGTPDSTRGGVGGRDTSESVRGGNPALGVEAGAAARGNTTGFGGVGPTTIGAAGLSTGNGAAGLSTGNGAAGLSTGTGTAGVPINNGTAGTAASGAVGTVTTLYIHGRNPSGLPTGWTYWNNDVRPNDARPGINAVPVNWDGTQRIAQTNAVIRDALTKYCTGENWCYVACHSVGCAQVGYALDLYGTTGGVETWNILWIAAAGSAAGGSEVADLQLFSTGIELDVDLPTQTMRALYNHDNTVGVTHWMFAGAGSSDLHPGYSASTSVILPGEDDVAVAYHSSCGINNVSYSATASWCNTTSLVCTGNRIESSNQENLWSFHRIQFLDAEGDYSHFLGDSNEGICSRMFAFVEQNAK